ncbi:MAG TPA: hypothetical protein VJ183_19285 [Chloroflexia bacterium]|nr:hypothetical protein [Chloroflexia bacterium]
MSADILRLIPINPEYMPDALSRERAAVFLKSLLLPNPDPSRDITTKVIEHVEFIDQGGNFERIVCPCCSSELTIKWWHEVMDKAYEKRFADLRIITPCCHTESSLNDLQYEMPAGFARFVLELYKPVFIDPILELSQDALEKLQDILGCRVRIIWAHY